ncbi:hypothetical protein BC830DRAFT_1158491 [Chytriomyces sp. MP71]|nr:hypothetical protein BC830DRAFT_1158491 [Chytriomyces sp. MP71]
MTSTPRPDTRTSVRPESASSLRRTWTQLSESLKPARRRTQLLKAMFTEDSDLNLFAPLTFYEYNALFESDSVDARSFPGEGVSALLCMQHADRSTGVPFLVVYWNQGGTWWRRLKARFVDPAGPQNLKDVKSFTDGMILRFGETSWKALRVSDHHWAFQRI